MQYFIRFEKVFASHGDRQNIYDLALGVKMPEYVFHFNNICMLYIYAPQIAFFFVK